MNCTNKVNTENLTLDIPMHEITQLKSRQSHFVSISEYTWVVSLSPCLWP